MKNKQKKTISNYQNKFLIFVLLICLIIILIVIANFSIKEPSNNNQSFKNMNLNLWIHDSDDLAQLYFKGAVNRFENQNPNIDLKIKFLQGNDQKAFNYSKAEILLSNNPDILALSLDNYNKFSTEGFLLDLNKYLKKYPEDYFFDTVIKSGNYQGQTNGIAYALNPEILVYRKELLDELKIPYPTNLRTLSDLNVYLNAINDIYSNDHLNKVAFSIPTTINNGAFLSSLINTEKTIKELNNGNIQSLNSSLQLLSAMYNSFDIVPYSYNKISKHPFFIGQAALSIEPISLIYSFIEKNNSFKKEIGIIPVDQFNFKCSYSQNKYLSIYSETDKKAICYLFFDFFFSKSEIFNRYRIMNLPIITSNLTKQYLSDQRFENKYLIDYIKESFHYEISPQQPLLLETLDIQYNQWINKGAIKVGSKK